jgi:hypothetical protein
MSEPEPAGSYPTPEVGCVVSYCGEQYEVVKVTPCDREGSVVRAERPGNGIVFPETALGDADEDVWLVA